LATCKKTYEDLNMANSTFVSSEYGNFGPIFSKKEKKKKVLWTGHSPTLFFGVSQVMKIRRPPPPNFI
jgi:hypothetical protein